MVNAYQELQTRIRRGVQRLMGDTARSRIPRHDLLHRISELDSSAYLFGGVVRDILLISPTHEFRDIDIVVKGKSLCELEDIFGLEVVRRNRFGGLQLEAKGWPLDVWPLEETLAVKERPEFPKDPETLPRTTFLSIEAVVVRLNKRPGRAREIFESRFFESILHKTIELNYEDTPFVSLNVLRAILTCRSLKFAMGPRLIDFICGHLRDLNVDELVKLQTLRYGGVKMNESQMSSCLENLRRWRTWHPGRPMRAEESTQVLFNLG